MSACSSSISSRWSRPGASWRRRRRRSSSPPHSSGCRPSVVSSVRTRSGLASGRSILLTATTIGTSAALAWSIASRVCGMTPSSAATTSTTTSVDAAAAGAHGGERLVARGVEERDRAAVVAATLVGADVLRDAAGLAGDDARLADGVEQARLAVVDVAHDRDDRGARDEVLGRVVERLLGLDLVGRARDRDLALELGADHLDGLVRERLRDADELAEAHHDLLDLRGRDAQRRCQVLDGDAGADGRGTRGRRDFLAALGAVLAAAAATALARVALRARGGGVDDDAPAAAELGAALRAGHARAAGRIGAGAVASGGRSPGAGCGSLARPGAPHPEPRAAGRAAPGGRAPAGRAAGGGAGAAGGAGRAARFERPPPRARAAAASSTVSPCRRTPASARRRATSPGSSPRSRAMSATRFLGI